MLPIMPSLFLITRGLLLFCNNAYQILYGYKKGADRCIYHIEALQSLRTINANDPRPERAVALGQTTKDRLKSRHSKLKHTVYAVCSRERSPCPRSCEICRFQCENKSKNSFTLLKNNL